MCVACPSLPTHTIIVNKIKVFVVVVGDGDGGRAFPRVMGHVLPLVARESGNAVDVGLL